jgi:transcriptional regulator with XRE-family HTH domain
MKTERLTPAEIDARLSSIAPHLDKCSPPAGGWLRTVRDSLGISQREAARLAGVTQQAFDQFESGELRASITLERLQKAAAALGCELVYFLQPAAETAGSFSGLAERRTAPKAPAAPPPVPAANRPDPEDLPVNLL